MPLINCKVELNFKWTKYCVLSAAGADNDNANPNNIIFIIKGTILYVPFITSSAKDNQKLYYLLKDIIKNYNVIINGKNFYDKAIDSDTK